MTQTHYLNWLTKVDALITAAIAGCYPRDWKEDLISYAWLKRLRDTLPTVSISGLGIPFAVAWDAYKVNGILEQQHGDIAVLVELRFSNKKLLRGVAFLEAKRSYKMGYRALKWSQLVKQSTAISNHRLLLYDYQPVRFNHWSVASQRPWYPLELRNTHAIAVPTIHALCFRAKSRKLHSLGVPLGLQLCTRYLCGLDLDHSPMLVRAVEHGVTGGIRFLLVTSVSVGNDIEPTLQRWQVNSQHYSILGDDDNHVENSTW